MNQRIVDARTKLDAARTEYVRQLRAVESLLRAAVAQSPENIGDAEALRGEYSSLAIELPPFSGLTQREPQHNDPQMPE